VDKKFKHLGHFELKEDAIRARKDAEKVCFGDFMPSP
jgi:hypothetical protein